MSESMAYVGIKPCGCKTSAMMVDYFSEEEIRSFVDLCKERGMQVELHDKEWVKKNFGHCEQHKQATQQTLF